MQIAASLSYETDLFLGSHLRKHLSSVLLKHQDNKLEIRTALKLQSGRNWGECLGLHIHVDLKVPLTKAERTECCCCHHFDQSVDISAIPLTS